MELNSSVNTFLQGMNLDSDISLLKENQYIYAENIRLLANEDSTTGVLQNRDCLKKFESQLKEREEILGTAVTRVFKDTASVECIVVITLYNNINSIYLIHVEDEITYKQLLSAEIGWKNKVKIVANYESDTVSKIYVADGINQLKVIDLSKEYDETVDVESFDILPNGFLKKPELLEIVSGNLKVGVVQYAYQLFQKNGRETSISTVSGTINIPKISSSSQKEVYGGNKNELSNCGVRIKIELSKTSGLDMFRLYRIRYESNNDVPNIYTVTEFEFDGDVVIYDDVSDVFINEITVDEFNMLTLTEFVPKTIEKHENRLFAANIKENFWDIEYDARAYRCDKNGNIRLEHSDRTKTIKGKLSFDGKIDGKNIPEKHDCINPSNDILIGEGSDTYMYGFKNGKLVLGGTGPNISYQFCFVDVICSDSKPNYSWTSNTYVPTVSIELNNSTKTNVVEIRNDEDHIIMNKTVPNTSGILMDYSDSFYTSNFLGYHRDEVYRFGIVFYNKKNQKSPVHWIGDIKIPHGWITENENSNFYPFHFNDIVRVNGVNKQVELSAKSIGIQFQVTNINEEVKKFEIVRCPRTETDRTIITQGALNSLVKFDTWGSNESNLGSNDLRPTSVLNWGEKYVTCLYGINHYAESEKNYVEFISPEVVVSQQNLIDNLLNSNICFTSLFYSYFPYNPEHVDAGINDYYSEDPFVAVKQEYIYTITDQQEPSYKYSSSATKLGSVKQYDTDDLPAIVLRGDGSGSSNIYGYYGNAMVFKPYRSISDPVNSYDYWNKPHNIKNAIVTKTLPFIWNSTEAKEYAQIIGNKTYINTSVGSNGMLNNHGVSAILNISDSNGFFVGGDKKDRLTVGVTPIVNIKNKSVLYGGNTYVSRTNSTYIPCVQHTNEFNEVCVFGGDTYLGVFDYTHTMFRQNSNDYSDGAENRLYVNCYIPLESSVNLNLFNNDTYSKTVDYTGISGTYSLIGQNLIQYEPFVSPSYTQTKPLYEYNSVYSSDANAQLFVPGLLYTDKNPIFETRIVSSELKTNNEIIDSWTKFKFTNYLDVDNQYGPVTNLKSFNGKLLFWQDSAVGVASVNERSLIQDNNIAQLTLGTGGILVRYDYHTTLNGSSISNDRSICNSSSTLYWYDTDKHEICAINNTVIELSKVKGVKSWCNKLLGRSETLGWYDWKYNEVLFQNKSEDVKRSIVFNEQLNTFTGFYTYPASHVAQMVDKLVTLDDMGNIYTHDSDVNYEPFESKITYVINKGYPETKVFDNVLFDAELSTDETLKSIVFKTKTQETNPVTFEGIENREDTYRFPIPRDKNGVARMRGKYLICDYTFDCTNDGDFKIPYIKTTFRISRV